MEASLSDDRTFEERVIKSDIPVLAEFFASWCGSCRMLESIVEKIEDEYAGKVRIVKIDVEHFRETAEKYRVMSVPTLILFKNGKPTARMVGAHSKSEIEKMIG